MNTINKNQRVKLPPTCFAFGGGTKPMSELMFNKYDKDKNGMLREIFASLNQIIFFRNNIT